MRCGSRAKTQEQGFDERNMCDVRTGLGGSNLGEALALPKRQGRQTEGEKTRNRAGKRGAKINVRMRANCHHNLRRDEPQRQSLPALLRLRENKSKKLWQGK